MTSENGVDYSDLNAGTSTAPSITRKFIGRL